jgi:molybdopterin synthase catalytic subunit
MIIKVQAEDFDLTSEVGALRRAHPEAGAIACFVGVVRELNLEAAGSHGQAQVVSQLELEHYPGMTEKALQAIVEEAGRRWALADALVIHRYGKLAPTDQIVLVAVATAHRGDAFAACEFIMDYLKTAAPFWKKESTPDGERWVEARAADDEAFEKWMASPPDGA